MKRCSIITVLAVLLSATPALTQAQGADGIGGTGYQFIKAVKDRDILKAKGFIDHPGSTVVNTRNTDGGDTALHMVTRDRDAPWMGFLLQEGADVNARDAAGNTPLIIAADQHFSDGVRLLLSVGALVDAQNRSGETALIKAVQAHDVPLVRLLVENGANADKTDNVAGLSARDYAGQDHRSTMISRLLSDGRAAKPASPAKPATPAPALATKP